MNNLLRRRESTFRSLEVTFIKNYVVSILLLISKTNLLYCSLPKNQRTLAKFELLAIHSGIQIDHANGFLIIQSSTRNKLYLSEYFWISIKFNPIWIFISLYSNKKYFFNKILKKLDRTFQNDCGFLGCSQFQLYI